MTIIKCKVLLVEAITDDIYCVRLMPEESFYFLAGQYLVLIINNNDKRLFSIASTPNEKKFIELHISISNINLYSMSVMNWIKNNNKVTIDIPYGNAWLRNDKKRPLILIAGGIGFSYIYSILQTALNLNLNNEINVYWGVREEKQLYYLSQLKSLKIHYPNLIIEPIVENPTIDWNGRTGKLLPAILQDFNKMKKYDIYIAGRFEMAKIARDLFCKERQANKDRIFSDAFSFI